MDIFALHRLHFQFSQEVELLEKDLEADKEKALQQLREQKNEIENTRLEERSMIQQHLGVIPPHLEQFIDEKRDFLLRQATQNYETKLENERKQFVEKISAVNKKWRALPFDVDYAVGVKSIHHCVHQSVHGCLEHMLIKDSSQMCSPRSH